MNPLLTHNHLFFMQDCSQKFLYFEKIQDLPTRGVYAVEYFTINANRFLTFANYQSDIEGHTTDSHLQAERFNWKFFPLPGYRVGILSFNFANSLLVKATTKVNDFNKLQLARSRSRSKTITTSFSG